MILVDSSAWIDFLSGRSNPWTEAVEAATRFEQVVVGDLILAEVLQGVSNERQWKATLHVLSLFPQRNLCNREIAEKSAENYRLLRRRGFTIRGTIDVVIATWCLANEAAIIHNDRDLAIMERELGLRSYAA